MNPLSLIDYPEKVSCIIWTPNCNFRCPFCHNRNVVLDKREKLQYIAEEDFYTFLEERKGLLDGIVVTGGEPTLQKDLPEFLKGVKDRGFLVKLDTNGSHPKIVENLLDQDLVDYIAMDVKAPFEKYEEVAGVSVDIETIKKSITLIKQRPVSYEFRTTVVPDLLSVEDIRKISKQIGDANYYLQQFETKKNEKTLDPSYMNKDPYGTSVLNEMCEIAKEYVENCRIRGI